MKKKIYVIIALMMGCMVMSCGLIPILEEEAPPFDPVSCLEVMARMTQIQVDLDNPTLSDGEKRELIAEFGELESWAESNCGQ